MPSSFLSLQTYASGAHLSFWELAWFLWFKILCVNPLMCVGNRSKTSSACRTAYYRSNLVPPEAHLSFTVLPLVPVVKNRYVSTY